MSEFDVELSRLQKVSIDMVSEMEKGLAKGNSSLLMLSTYVYNLPNGSESGNFLALDFGGSTFRVIYVKLVPGEKPTVKSTTVSMDQKMKNVPGAELFDHLAQYVCTFVEQENLSEGQMPLGFTFSFPMKQSSLAIGTLVQWTKGFENSDVVGLNVAKLLQESLLKIKATENIKVVALANDTAGTQIAGALNNCNCHAGLILGTGTNAAYTEKVANVSVLEGCTEENVIINIEWGNFGALGHLADVQTKYDKLLDEASNNTGRQIFEKMISGMYIGELVRLALLDRVENKTLFDGTAPALLMQENSFDGAVVSNCISEEEVVRELLPAASPDEVQCIRGVCEAVSVRAARLAAAGIKAIWLKRGKGALTVGVDGSVFTKHCIFAREMRSALADLGCADIRLETVCDGSGLGSALIAAIAV